MIPVGIYARYSTDEQDPRSIEDQVRRCTEHATTNAYRVVDEFPDEAISGAHTDRAELRRMLTAATAKGGSPFRAVLVDDLSRLSRNIGDFWRIIDDLAAVGVKVIDVQTGMSSDQPNARQMFGMKSLFADQMLETIRYQTRRGLEGRARAGFWTGGSVFGFATHPEAAPSNAEYPRMLPEIDETEAPIVRRIFRMSDEGHGYRPIADALNREGVTPPRNNGRGGKHGGGWSHTTVRSILQNEKYVGVWIWNKTRSIRVPGKKSRRFILNPESEWVIGEFPERAIVDRATWERVQARIAKRKRGDEQTMRKGQQVTLVSGLLRCGACGGPLSVRSAKIKAGVRYVNYGCTAHSSRGGAICDNAKTISALKLTDALVEALHGLLTGPDVEETFARAAERKVNERRKGDKPGELERQFDAARKRVLNATRLIVEMPDDLDIRSQREADRAEVRRLEAELAERRTTTKPRALPDRSTLGAAVGKFLNDLTATNPARGRAVLVKYMSPLTVTPKIKGPNRFEVVGSVDLFALAAGAASGSSGGAILPLAVLPLLFAA